MESEQDKRKAGYGNSTKYTKSAYVLFSKFLSSYKFNKKIPLYLCKKKFKIRNSLRNSCTNTFNKFFMVSSGSFIGCLGNSSRKSFRISARYSFWNRSTDYFRKSFKNPIRFLSGDFRAKISFEKSFRNSLRNSFADFSWILSIHSQIINLNISVRNYPSKISQQIIFKNLAWSDSV